MTISKTTLFLFLLLGSATCPAEEPDPLAFTIWGPQAELFVEFSPLVVGQPSRMAIHLTDMRDSEKFLPVASGTVDVTLEVAGAAPVRTKADPPRIPGIFGATVVPASAGAARVTIALTSPGASDRFTLQTQVNATAADVKDAPQQEVPGEEVPFLKEQQWQIPFATAKVTKRRIGRSVHAVGDVTARAGSERHVHTPKAGRLEAPRGGIWPLLGRQVRAGETLAVLSPATPPDVDRTQLELEDRQASVELAAAARTLERAERLAAQGAVARRELDEARKQRALAQERAAASIKRLGYFRSRQAGSASTGTRGLEEYQVLSPIDGTIVQVHASAGEQVDAAEVLFTILEPSRVWIVGRVFEPDIAAVRTSSNASFRLLGVEEPLTLESLSGHLVTVGELVDTKTRTVPIIFEVANEARRLLIGQFVDIEIDTGGGQQVLAVPETAVYDDGGRDVVFVQPEGESFRKRRVRTGARQKGFVELVSGVSEGERVATVGGYEIYLQSVSKTIPEHGHAH
ncbi:MAG: efflux RND transporter periplasmic adaptor subunit [Candidatus Wallbacteria bacterium]|nr:efflux RND transporter periplasmic adaptor subunit [Candidatus Wallbacteria bacterium]